MSLTARPEASYPDIDTACTELQAHGKEHGNVLFRYARKPSRVYFACDRVRKYHSRGKDLNTHSFKQRQNTGSKKSGCLMKVVLRLDSLSNQRGLKVHEPSHNHRPSTASTASTTHHAHRIAAIAPSGRTTISTLLRAGLLLSQILNTLRILEPEVAFIPKDIGQPYQKARLEQLNGRTPIQRLSEVKIPAILATAPYSYRP
jgi:hypothetical protein